MSYSINNQVKEFIPNCVQEEVDKKEFIDSERKYGDILHRDNEICHLTSSCFAINREHNKVLCLYHNIYKSWGWQGGHSDGDDDLLYVAKKEFAEETGIKDFDVLCEGKIVSLDTIPVVEHYKNGKFIKAHKHYNVAYLFETDENNAFRIKEDENSDMGWLTFEDLIKKSTEKHMISIYKKIVSKIYNLEKEKELCINE